MINENYSASFNLNKTADHLNNNSLNYMVSFRCYSLQLPESFAISCADGSWSKNTWRVPLASRFWFAAKLVCSAFLSHSLQGGTSRKERNELEPPVRLFQIRGIEIFNRKAVEVPASAASLNSNDVFLLKTQGDHYLWYGKVRPRALGVGENVYISLPLTSKSL